MLFHGRQSVCLFPMLIGIVFSSPEVEARFPSLTFLLVPALLTDRFLALKFHFPWSSPITNRLIVALNTLKFINFSNTTAQYSYWMLVTLPTSPYLSEQALNF